ncbi:MAG: penicillin-binding protein activator [Hyphomonadaceae bacterium]|nr:penicillin-binding protein activator [Hyphomonadaceae bacterium]
MRRSAACLCVALLAACSTNGPDSQTGSLNVESKAEHDRPQVKIGLLVPLSAQGQPGVIGKSLKQAAELALFERDNPNLQLIVKDDKGTPDGARAAAEDALKSGATLILGPLFAKSVSMAAPVARKAGIPVIAFSNDRQVAGNGVYLLSFQPAPEVERVIAYAISRGKRRYAALIPQDAFGKIVEPVFHNAVGRGGGAVVAVETYHPGSANAMLEPLRKISAAITAADAEGGPVDALFVPGGQEHLEALGRLLPQAQIDTQQVKLIGTGGMDYPNAGRDAGLVGAWYPGPDPRGWTEFAQRYAKSYNHAPPRIASLAYDAVNLAIALAGGPGGQRYTAATITRSGGFAGIDGPYRLLADGTADRSLAILEVQRFGASIAEIAPSAPSPPPAPTAVSGAGFNIFNFLTP